MSTFRAVVPDLHEGAGVVHCNPERTRLVAQLRSALAPGEWDDGESGGTAAACASRFAQTDAGFVTILAGPRDLRGAAILEAACRAVGLDVVVQRTSASGTIHEFPQRIVTAGARWIGVPTRAAERATFLRTVQEWRARVGGAEWRLTPPPLAAFPAGPGRRSPLPAGLALQEPEWRRGLLSLVAEHFPRRYPAFLCAVGAHDLGANPVEDAYAGRGLRERNAELLVNLIDPA